MAYRIEIRKSARAEISSLPNRDQRRIMLAVAGLADDPRPVGVRKLAGIEDSYRIRVGDYRVIYSIADQVLLVYVVRVAHRKDVYRGL